MIMWNEVWTSSHPGQIVVIVDSFLLNSDEKGSIVIKHVFELIDSLCAMCQNMWKYDERFKLWVVFFDNYSSEVIFKGGVNDCLKILDDIDAGGESFSINNLKNYSIIRENKCGDGGLCGAFQLARQILNNNEIREQHEILTPLIVSVVGCNSSILRKNINVCSPRTLLSESCIREYEIMNSCEYLMERNSFRNRPLLMCIGYDDSGYTHTLLTSSISSHHNNIANLLYGISSNLPDYLFSWIQRYHRVHDDNDIANIINKMILLNPTHLDDITRVLNYFLRDPDMMD